MSRFSFAPSGLIEARNRLTVWLAADRGLTHKVPNALPECTHRRMAYLGFEVTRAGVRPGARAREQLAGRVRAATTPAALESSLAALRTHWMFGSPEG